MIFHPKFRFVVPRRRGSSQVDLTALSAGTAALLALGPVAPVTVTAHATYLDLMGFVDYATLPSSGFAGIADGTGVAVGQAEANASTSGPSYRPNPNNGELSGITFTDESGLGGGNSGHALSVARNFYGATTSGASGITQVGLFEADAYLNVFLDLADPDGDGNTPQTSNYRVINHSWVGNIAPGGVPNASANQSVLLMSDHLVHRDNIIQVVGMQNDGFPDAPIFANSFNAIVVGLTNNDHVQGGTTADSGTFYSAGRQRPDLVTPGFEPGNGTIFTSWSAPIISSMSAMLVETGMSNPGLSRGTLVTGSSLTISHAETAEVIKSVLMAGADRNVDNARGADLTDYTVDTANNLDARYGAGQANIYNSHSILAGGEQRTATSASATTLSASTGWDYEGNFGTDTDGDGNASTYDDQRFYEFTARDTTLQPPSRSPRRSKTMPAPFPVFGRRLVCVCFRSMPTVRSPRSPRLSPWRPMRPTNMSFSRASSPARTTSSALMISETPPTPHRWIMRWRGAFMTISRRATWIWMAT